MLHTVFYLVLNMSIVSCLVIVVLLVLRQIKSLKRGVVYPLWSFAFLRMIIPFTFATPWSLFNYTGKLVKRLLTVEVISGGTISSPSSDKLLTMNVIGVADEYFPIVYKSEILHQVFDYASVVWLIIASAMIIAALVLYLLTRKELKQALPIRDNLYHSSTLLSPVIVGIVKARVIIPDFLDPDSAECQIILQHENVHRRRWDNLWRIVAITLTCIHWFNPLAWLSLKAFFTDMEQSCDEEVVKGYNQAERATYARTLLRYAENNRLLLATAFGNVTVKTRIVNVLNYKRLTLFGTFVSTLLLLIIAVVLLTNPQLKG